MRTLNGGTGRKASVVGSSGLSRLEQLQLKKAEEEKLSGRYTKNELVNRGLRQGRQGGAGVGKRGSTVHTNRNQVHTQNNALARKNYVLSALHRQKDQEEEEHMQESMDAAKSDPRIQVGHPQS